MKTTIGLLLAMALAAGLLLNSSGTEESSSTAYASERAPISAATVVTGVTPAANSAETPASTELAVDLAEALDAASFAAEDFSVYGRWSGVMQGEATLEAGGRRVRFVPSQPFHAGEWVTASLSRDVQTAAGVGFSTGYTWGFWIRPEGGSLTMTDRGERTVLEGDEEHVQPYGAYAGDFNGDGFSDLAIPNEVATDVRVMLNDGQGNYEEFTVLEIPDGNWPSPNEGADFNRDGIVDFAVGNAGNDMVTVFLGDGSGGFRVGQSYPAARGVRGVCVMDLNGDGWTDVATANMSDGEEQATRGSVSILINDGTGRLERTTTIPSPGRGEKTCATGDANSDGILDLFVGAFNTGQVILFLGDGNGGLALETTVSAGGNPWMIVTADVNGDHHVDVLAANREGNNVAVILGDGRGNLADPVTYETGEQPLAVDVGDLDGDGDLEVVTSDFVGNSFTIFENAGDGTLVRRLELPASAAGSCAIIHDRDRDGDLDITGVDEVDDKIFLFENEGG